MKVNKEEILGMYVALEEFVKIDHDKEYALFQKRIDRIKASADQVTGVKTVVRHPTLGNVTPTLDITWDPARITGDGNTLREALRKGSPSIEVVGGRDNLSITAWSLREGEDAVVAKRVREVLEQASVKA
jgi:L-seryl-tRNA(Ser) seleniumtransferase